MHSSTGSSPAEMGATEEITAQTRQFTTFWLDGLLFGVEATLVQEVIRYQEMTPVPLAPAAVQGLINLRGQIVTAIDLRRRIGSADRIEDTRPMNVLVHTADGVVSLLVDQIDDVIDVDEAQFKPVPDTVGPAGALIGGVYQLPERLLLILDVAKAVTVDEASA